MEGGCLDDTDRDMIIVLKQILKKEDRMVRARFIRLTSEDSGELL
jgi:hypothetical protein